MRMASLPKVVLAGALLASTGVVGTGAAGAAEVTPGTRYSVTDLGPPAGYEETQASGISQDGSVAGSTLQNPFGAWPVVWAPDGAPHSLEHRLPESVEGGNGYAISDDGRYVAGSVSVTGAVPGCPGPACGFIDAEGALTFFEAPWIVEDVNNDGVVVGGATGAMCTEAALWHNGSSQRLGTLGGGCGSEANGVNNDGEIVGQTETDPNGHGRAPFLWRDGTMRELPNEVANCRDGEATEINDAEQIVGWTATYGLFIHGPECKGGYAALWRPGGMALLGQSGGFHSFPQDINEHGHIVGYTSSGYVADFPYFIDDGETFDLNDAISPGSGWLLEEAHAINDAGQITGWGVLDGKVRAFRLDPLEPYELDTNTRSGPLGRVRTTKASFSFRANRQAASFMCSLDGAAPTPCSSPVTYSGLRQGRHTFSVHAIKDGEVESTASVSDFVVNSLRMQKIRFDPPGTDTKANLNGEWVRFANVGGTPLQLREWTLSDIQGNTFTFPRFRVSPGSTVTVHTGRGTRTAQDLYWGRRRHVWNNDFDEMWLKRRDGAPADRCPYDGASLGATATPDHCLPYDKQIFG